MIFFKKRMRIFAILFLLTYSINILMLTSFASKMSGSSSFSEVEDAQVQDNGIGYSKKDEEVGTNTSTSENTGSDAVEDTSEEESNEPGGIFETILNFIKSLFESILSIFDNVFNFNSEDNSTNNQEVFESTDPTQNTSDPNENTSLDHAQDTSVDTAQDTEEETDYIPAPIPADTGKYLVGAQLCPIWDTTNTWKGVIEKSSIKPVLGYYDEKNPEVTDWEIKYALEHGVSFFSVIWFREKSNIGKSPVKPWRDHWVENVTSKSKFKDQIKFMISFENSNEAASSANSKEDLVDNLFKYWMDNYFKESNYLVLDGKILLGIHSPEKLAKQIGGEKALQEAIKEMEALSVKEGFSGLTILGQYCWGSVNYNHQLEKNVGIDYSYAYNLPTFIGDLMPATNDNNAIMKAQQDYWLAKTKTSIPGIASLSVGWDSTPWNGFVSKRKWKLSPKEFESLLSKSKSFVDSGASKGLGSKMVLLDNWNEYGEGHYIFPTEKDGFAYLDAVRNVFAPNAGEHEDIVPKDVNLGPYDLK